ncbi:MAG TPA: hypothetical protein PL004_12645 [Bacillota bacterium]|nr:hypothetical protein [Bacillota bacterium]
MKKTSLLTLLIVLITAIPALSQDTTVQLLNCDYRTVASIDPTLARVILHTNNCLEGKIDNTQFGKYVASLIRNPQNLTINARIINCIYTICAQLVTPISEAEYYSFLQQHKIGTSFWSSPTRIGTEFNNIIDEYTAKLLTESQTVDLLIGLLLNLRQF